MSMGSLTRCHQTIADLMLSSFAKARSLQFSVVRVG